MIDRRVRVAGALVLGSFVVVTVWFARSDREVAPSTEPTFVEQRAEAGPVAPRVRIEETPSATSQASTSVDDTPPMREEVVASVRR